MLCLKRLFLIPCQKMKWYIIEKLVLDGADFDFSLILEFAMVIRFAAFSSFMSQYSIKHTPIIFI